MRNFSKRRYSRGFLLCLKKFVILSMCAGGVANAAIPSSGVFDPLIDDYFGGFKGGTPLPVSDIIFSPIIEDYHEGFKKTDKIAPDDWGDVDVFQ